MPLRGDGRAGSVPAPAAPALGNDPARRAQAERHSASLARPLVPRDCVQSALAPHHPHRTGIIRPLTYSKECGGYSGDQPDGAIEIEQSEIGLAEYGSQFRLELSLQYPEPRG